MYPSQRETPIDTFDLIQLGWDDRLSEQFQEYRDEGLVPGRVSVQHRGAWDVLTEAGELRVDAAGRLSHEAGTSAERPVVGDWVAVAVRPDEGTGTIQAVLPRRTRFSRKATLDAASEQVLAANVDVVFIVTSLNEDLSFRRLERYLILAWESGAAPVILLTKSDLADDAASTVAEVAAIAPGVPVHAVSARTGEGIDDVRGHVGPGRTAALLGSSGVGKSTIVNTLLGEDVFETREIQGGGKGRHTTTRRQLVALPEGGLVIDTPGMRELQLWVADVGLDEAFEDVSGLAGHCRFSDCAHETEPGCAVQAALAQGTLAPERWQSYRKLQRELEALERRLDARAQAEERRRWRVLSKAMRARTQGRPR